MPCALFLADRSRQRRPAQTSAFVAKRSSALAAADAWSVAKAIVGRGRRKVESDPGVHFRWSAQAIAGVGSKAEPRPDSKATWLYA